MTGQQVLEAIRERDGDGELRAVMNRLAKAHAVTVEELLGRSRNPAASHARQAFWAALHATGNWSYARLGRFFGRDHVSIMWGITAHHKRNGATVPERKRFIAVVGNAWMSCEQGQLQ